MEELTQLLKQAGEGDAQAAEQLLPRVYEELRRLAAALMRAERPGQTLQATALVHEAYLRLIGSEKAAWNDHRHFFNAAAMAMRRCLVDRARHKKRIKHGGESERMPLDGVELPAEREFATEDFEHLEAALLELAEDNARWADVINLRLFLGMSVEETARILDVSPATVKNDWKFGIAWLRLRLKQSEPGAGV